MINSAVKQTGNMKKKKTNYVQGGVTSPKQLPFFVETGSEKVEILKTEHRFAFSTDLLHSKPKKSDLGSGVRRAWQQICAEENLGCLRTVFNYRYSGVLSGCVSSSC